MRRRVRRSCASPAMRPERTASPGCRCGTWPGASAWRRRRSTPTSTPRRPCTTRCSPRGIDSCSTRPVPREPDVTRQVAASPAVSCDFSVADPARYQLLFQRTIPGFAPRRQSWELAEEVYRRGIGSLLGYPGVRPEDLDLVTAVLTGLVRPAAVERPRRRPLAAPGGRRRRHACEQARAPGPRPRPWSRPGLTHAVAPTRQRPRRQEPPWTRPRRPSPGCTTSP